MFDRFAPLAQLPELLVWVVGIVLAFVWWRRHPGVSLLASAGLVLLMIRAALAGVAAERLPLWLHMRGLDFGRPMLFGGLLNLGLSLLGAAGAALLVAAIFAGRRSPAGASRPPAPEG
jgi:hypothetical protein